jgi:hypothetical protein
MFLESWLIYENEVVALSVLLGARRIGAPLLEPRHLLMSGA